MGVWKLDHGCFRGENVRVPEERGDACSIEDKAAKLAAAGEVEFRADASFSYTLALNGTVVLQMAPACLPATGGCSSLETSLAMSGLTCTGVAALGCECSVQINDEPETEVGHYEIAGTDVILYYEDRVEPSRVKYCGRGDELLSTFPVSDFLANGEVTLLFRKQ